MALGIGSSFSLAVAAGREVASEERGALERQGIEPSLHSPRSDARRPAWLQIGTKAGADYHGDGLAVSPTAQGARLRCVFQRLEGEATREGLWLTSTVIPRSGTVNDRFRVGFGDGRRLSGCPVVLALAVSGSDLYAGGEFTTAGGISAANIAKWNGSSWSALGSGMGATDDGTNKSVTLPATNSAQFFRLRRP